MDWDITLHVGEETKRVGNVHQTKKGNLQLVWHVESYSHGDSGHPKQRRMLPISSMVGARLTVYDPGGEIDGTKVYKLMTKKANASAWRQVGTMHHIAEDTLEIRITVCPEKYEMFAFPVSL